MAIAQLFFKKAKFIDTIEFDAFITEGATTSSSVTSNPVQNAADSNDHIISNPMTFEIQGIISNIASNVIQQFTRNAFTGREDIKTWKALTDLQASKNLFTLVLGLRSYKNVQILTLSHIQDKDTSTTLVFTATLQEILIPPSKKLLSFQVGFADQATADAAGPSIDGGLKQLGITF